ncbi:MAG: MMPL family transporter [Actinomycetota bacterium]|nr:MMPL family transporter [Actinomycetota bacterium]
MSSLLHRLGLATVRHRALTLVIWLLVLVGAGVGAATLSGQTSNTFSIPGQESTTALTLIETRFGSSGGASAQVAVLAPAGKQVTSAPVATQVAGLVSSLKGLPGVVSVTNPLDPARPVVSRDRQASYITLTYAAKAADITPAQRDALTTAVAGARTGGLSVEVSGEATRAPVDIGGVGEIVGVVAALVVLALTYGALVAAGMNLLTALVGVGVGALGVTIATGFVDLQSTTPILATMLGLAVGIDYALFIVTRHRAELRAGRSVPDAAALAVGTAGSAVVVAGATVVIALAGLAVSGIPFLTQMGLAAAGTVVVAVFVALTLVPAALGFVGLRILPRRQRTAVAGTAPPAETAGVLPELPRGRGFIAGWAAVVTRHRWPSLLLGLVALGVMALPVLSLRTSLVPTPADGSTEARAQAIVAEHFGPGVNGPLLVLVDAQGATGGAGAVASTTRLADQVKGLPGVALVTPPIPNAAGTAALLTVVPTSAPDSTQTEDLVHAIRDQVKADQGLKAYVSGATAVSVDVSESLRRALPVYLVLVVGLAMLLLVLVFRSVLVPVTGVLGFLLTIGASLGATTAVFQWGWLGWLLHPASTGPLLSLAPIIIVGILFGLAMDYQVFLVSRMHEAHAHGAEPLEAVRHGFRAAGPVVVAAAVIMSSVFGGFASGHDLTVKSLAFALAVGVLVDAIVVRMVLMPAALAILGRAAWWFPSWLRWLPDLDVEGAELTRTRTAGASSTPPVDRDPTDAEVGTRA